MSMKNDLKLGPPSASDIVKFMARHNKPVMVSEVKKELNKDWNTLKRSFDWLEKIGRVHQRFIGGNKYFELNGKGKHQTHFDVDDNTRLWIDIFEPTEGYNQHFVRVKQSRRTGLSSWEPISTINIRKDKLSEFIEELNNINGTLKKYY